jgi:ribosome maturation factor RimP
MDLSVIANMVNEHFAGSDKFLVDIFIKPTNRIYVFIDGDHGVTIADCVGLSRHLEAQFDRETEDFELNVSSSGADQPIKLPRQYPKNIGRSLQLKLEPEEEIKGKLIESSDQGITLEIKGKKKTDPVEKRIIPFDQIKEAKVIIAFK